jgi:hypothetical protein
LLRFTVAPIGWTPHTLPQGVTWRMTSFLPKRRDDRHPWKGHRNEDSVPEARYKFGTSRGKPSSENSKPWAYDVPLLRPSSNRSSHVAASWATIGRCSDSSRSGLRPPPHYRSSHSNGRLPSRMPVGFPTYQLIVQPGGIRTTSQLHRCESAHHDHPFKEIDMRHPLTEWVGGPLPVPGMDLGSMQSPALAITISRYHAIDRATSPAHPST